jgi:hypothetical protein
MSTGRFEGSLSSDHAGDAGRNAVRRRIDPSEEGPIDIKQRQRERAWSA